ncbi:MAG: NADPH-dependent glutamate synthase [Gammaproteobacteria bacterium]|nr:NADPH-dependent glutamate synthase [Gammaproteobacteria bacterium]
MPVKRVDTTPMPQREPSLSLQDSEEVNDGYCFAEAMLEAERCLRCQDPACIEGCPVRVPIFDFMHAVAAGDLPKAARLLRAANPLAALCGRVCPQEPQCEMKCHMSRQFGPMAIGHVERCVSEWEMRQAVNHEVKEPTRDEKIAIVGSGPAGLVCAGELARMGYRVTVYEALHAPGGALRYGIPESRLPNYMLDWDIGFLERLGVEFVNDMIIGKNMALEALFEDEGYSAVFIGTGAGLPKFMGIPGESLNGVLSADEFLTRINLMQAFEFPEGETPLKVGKHVAVIGSGNTAVDAARSALCLGAKKVMVVHRCNENEMTARVEEYERANEEGVEFHWRTHPIEALGEEGWVAGLKCVKMEPGEPDESGRGRPVPVEGSEFVLPVDNVVLSIGTRPNPLLATATPGLKTHPRGGLLVNKQKVGSTVHRVFAGGDAVTGAATVILAAGAGKRAAEAIDADLAAAREKAAS